MEIAWIGGDKKERRLACERLEGLHYHVTRMDSLTELAPYLRKATGRTLIIDLDAMPIGKNFFRDLKRTNPDICILGLSSRPFHPELGEAFSQHLYACLKKPVDMDELLYLLKDKEDRNEDSKDEG